MRSKYFLHRLLADDYLDRLETQGSDFIIPRELLEAFWEQIETELNNGEIPPP